ncbi:hypothetical protein GWD52_06245 [Enterobacteriaceae bacterium 4M9]|nr:hypothetical protein [Enterobacteriaceae bacterium 4M9]
MLSIHVETQNEFYRLGVTELIKTLTFHSETDRNVNFIEDCNINEKVNVIVGDTAIIVNIFDKTHSKKEGDTEEALPRARVFLPFNVRNRFTSEIVIKMHKIIKIAGMSYKKNMAMRIFKETGLHKRRCITETESDIIRLTGLGTPVSQLSEILEQPRYRIAAHRRNATRKLGMINRIQLYQFSSVIKEYYIDENIFICI